VKEIYLDKIDITIYYEKLKNGLQVFFVPIKDKKKYYMTYATKYGSIDTSFVPNGKNKEIKTSDGIAHFLEHKLFESEDGIDPFEFFAKSGSVGNASTSFESTQYLCYGTRAFEENLDHLLTYVNNLYLTYENVEKEKGIIEEELKMYEDIPEYVLQFAIRKNLYHVHPNRIDIGGTVESVRKTTKEELETCYNTFYQPNNMFLIVSGNFNKDIAIDIVHKKLDSNQNKNKNIKRKKYKEPNTVYKEQETIKRDIAIPKAAVAFKFDKSVLGEFNDEVLETYLAMFTALAFGEASKFREVARERNLLNSFSSEWEIVDNYRSLLLFLESKDIDAFIDLVIKELKNIEVTEEDIERIKKVWIANSVKVTDYVEDMANIVYDDVVKYGRMIDKRMDIIKNVNKKKLDTIISNMNFKNKAIVKLLPEEK